MEQITEGSESWRLPFGPHLMEGNGIPAQLWAPLAAQMGISIIAAAQTYDALNPTTSPAGGWDTEGIHITEAVHGNIRDIVEQARRAWNPQGEQADGTPAASDVDSEEDTAEEPPPPEHTGGHEDPASQDVAQCPICLERPRPGIGWATLGCGHGIHPPCLEEHRISGTRSYGATEATCPCCRAPILVTNEELYLAGPTPPPAGSMDGPGHEPEGFRTHEFEEGPLGILLLSTGGGFSQALHSELRRKNIEAAIILVTAVRIGPGEAADTPWLVSCAVNAWGTRVTQLCARISPVGGPIGITDGATGHLIRLVAGIIPVHAVNMRSALQPETRIAGCTREQVIVRITVQKEAYSDAVSALLFRQRQLAITGGTLTYDVTNYKQGREMNMAASGLFDVFTFTATIGGRNPRTTAAELCEALGTLEGSTGAGNAVFTWGPDEWAEAVLFPVPRGAIPAVIEGIRRASAAFPVRAWACPRGVFIGGLPPAIFTGYAAAAGIQEWLTAMKPPIRILGRTSANGTIHVWLREGSRGHAQRCIARTGGAFSPEEVARAASAKLRVLIYGTQVQAFDPILESYQTMTLLTAPPQGPAVLERLITGETSLYVSQQHIPIYPYTIERTPQARAPMEDDSARLLFEAAEAGGTAGHNCTFSIPAAIHNANAAGERSDGEARHIHLAGTDQSAWPTLYPSSRNNTYVHPLTRGHLLVMHPSGDEAATDSDDGGEHRPGNADHRPRAGLPSLPRTMTAAAVRAAWVDEHSVEAPAWEQGHGAERDDLLTWDTELQPRETLWVAIGASGSISIRGPGEEILIIFPQPCWARLHIPASAHARAAFIGAAPTLIIRVEHAVGGGWSSRLKPRVGQQANRPPPAAPAQVIYAAENAPIAAGLGEDLRLPMKDWVRLRTMTATGGEQGGYAGEISEKCLEAARAALSTWCNPVPQQLLIAFARWLQLHISRQLAKGSLPISWQWHLAIPIWVFEACGIHQLYLADHEYASELVGELDLNAPAARHQPFLGWTLGHKGGVPGRTFAGMRGRGKTRFLAQGYSVRYPAVVALRHLVNEIRGEQAAAAAPQGPPAGASSSLEPTPMEGVEAPAATDPRGGSTGVGAPAADHPPRHPVPQGPPRTLGQHGPTSNSTPNRNTQRQLSGEPGTIDAFFSPQGQPSAQEEGAPPGASPPAQAQPAAANTAQAIIHHSAEHPGGPRTMEIDRGAATRPTTHAPCPDIIPGSEASRQRLAIDRLTIAANRIAAAAVDSIRSSTEDSEQIAQIRALASSICAGPGAATPASNTATELQTRAGEPGSHHASGSAGAGHGSIEETPDPATEPAAAQNSKTARPAPSHAQDSARPRRQARTAASSGPPGVEQGDLPQTTPPRTRNAATAQLVQSLAPSKKLATGRNGTTARVAKTASPRIQQQPPSGGSSGSTSRAQAAPLTGGDTSPVAGPEGRRIFLLSLFDGVGTAFVALNNFCKKYHPGKLAGGWFAEICDELASSTAEHWAARHAAGDPFYERACGDVWHLLRENGARLHAILARIEPGAMLLIAGGSPCQQLSTMGAAKGRQGLCGPESRNFFIFPLLLWAAQTARPDLAIHVVAENAGSMLPHFRAAFLETLGLPEEEGPPRADGHAPIIDAARFSAYPRARMFASTLSPTQRLWNSLPPRPCPWETNWERRSHGGCPAPMPTMMRSRGFGHNHRASTYQYHPDYLLFHTDLRAFSANGLYSMIMGLLPFDLREGWRIIKRKFQNNGPEEHICEATADWIQTHGRELGFRIPTGEERAAAYGMGPYLISFGLSPRDLFDATGNMFDPDALLARIACPLDAWIRGGSIAPATPTNPAALTAIYERLRTRVTADGLAACLSPAPIDMTHIFASICSWNRQAAAWQPAANAHQRDNHLAKEVAAEDDPPWSQESVEDSISEDRELPFRYGAVLNTHNTGTPKRGFAGSHAALKERNTCVADSLGQLFGAARGATDISAAAAAAEASRMCWDLCGEAHSSTVPVALGWLIATSLRYGPDDPRPMLLEAYIHSTKEGAAIIGWSRNGNNGPHAEAHRSESAPGPTCHQQVALHAGYGPWDGRIIAVATGNGHTEPLWWPPASDSAALQACLTIEGQVGPAIPWVATHDLAAANTCALIYGMRAFHGKATCRAPAGDRAPVPNRPCRWQGQTSREGAWPQAAGSPPSVTKLKSILQMHQIATNSIIGDAHRWARGLETAPSEESAPHIIAIAGEYGAWVPPTGSCADQGAASIGSIGPAETRMVARGSGGCHAILICHETGHIWATAGADTERRIGRILRAAGLERIIPKRANQEAQSSGMRPDGGTPIAHNPAAESGCIAP